MDEDGEGCGGAVLAGGAEGAAAASVRREERAAPLVSRSPLVNKFRV